MSDKDVKNKHYETIISVMWNWKTEKKLCAM